MTRKFFVFKKEKSIVVFSFTIPDFGDLKMSCRNLQHFQVQVLDKFFVKEF